MKTQLLRFVRLVIAADFLCLAVAFTTVPAAPLPQSSSNGGRSPDTNDPAARTGKWKKQEGIPTPWGLYDVDMVSATEGWAVSHPITGDHANIFHTTNGGKTWKQQGGLFSQLSGISFADALHGVAVGNEYRFTVDGGKTWQSGSASTDIEKDTIAGRTGSLLKSGVWQAPSSRPGTEPDGTK